jgi:Family of unknown function (DUF6492)
MKPLVLYCKSYSTDVRRIVRLAQSVQEYNRDNLPFHVSVPRSDLPLFREYLAGMSVELLADEEIIQASPQIDLDQIHQMRGSVSQQIVKSEFWRLKQSEAYLCLDSDAIFIRPFGLTDFLASNGTPYTVIDEAHELLEDALRHRKTRVLQAFSKESNQVQQLFQRVGRHYSFGPFPLVWHRSVWESLDTHYLQPKGMSFADAIAQVPIESRWYGEALLAYRAISLLPCQTLFKVYHYAWQLDKDRRAKIGTRELAQFYCGVIYQSAWEREMDWPTEGGNYLSRTGRLLRRKLGRI